MVSILEPFTFDAVYGSFPGRGQIDANGKEVVAASVARYIADQQAARCMICRLCWNRRSLLGQPGLPQTS